MAFDGETLQLRAYAPDPTRPPLSPAAEERLWRRRAIVHAIVQSWDDARGWSEAPAWRRLSGWGLTGPLLEPPAAFLSHLGRMTPQRELVTAAELLLVPPESVDPLSVPVDDQARCQELSRGRFLARALGLPGRGACPRLDRWLDPARVQSVEVLYAEPTTAHPESLFGHLSLGVVRPDEPLRALQAVALASGHETGASFIWKGLTGGMDAVFASSSLAAVLEQNNVLEQRTLRRFRLRLSKDEQTRVLERAWELERRGYGTYRFFTANCAGLLVFLLDGAFDDDRQISLGLAPWAMPAAVLDAIDASAPGGRLRPATTHLADQQRALAARRERVEVMAQLSERAPAFALPSLDSSDRESRRQDAVGMVDRVRAAPPGARDLLRRLLPLLLEEQRLLADRATAAALALDRGRARLDVGPTAAALKAERQALYAHERDDLQEREDLREFVQLAARWAAAPRRPPTPDEAEAARDLEAEQQLFLTWAGAVGDALDGLGGPLEAPPPPPPPETDAPGPWSSGSVAAVGLQARAAGGDWRPGLRVELALLRERLGEPRERGLAQGLEVHLLDLALALERQHEHPAVTQAELEVVRVRTALQDPPGARGLARGRLGVGFGLSVEQDVLPVPSGGARLHGEAVWPALDGERLQAGVALGAEALARWRGPGPLALGPRLEAFAHLRLGPADGLFGEAVALPRWDVRAGREQEARLRLGCDLYLGTRQQPAVLRLFGEATWIDEGPQSVRQGLLGVLFGT